MVYFAPFGRKGTKKNVHTQKNNHFFIWFDIFYTDIWICIEKVVIL